MKLYEVIDLLPLDEVIVTPATRQAGGQYAMALLSPLADNTPYTVYSVDKIMHEEGTGKLRKTVMDRANIYLKGFNGTRFDPASFEIVKP